MDSPAGDQRKAERSFNEASPAAAKNGLLVAEWPPGKAESRTPVCFIGITQIRRNAGLCRGKDGRGRDGALKSRWTRMIRRKSWGLQPLPEPLIRRVPGAVNRIKGGAVGVNVVDGRVQFIAQPKIQSETGSTFQSSWPKMA